MAKKVDPLFGVPDEATEAKWIVTMAEAFLVFVKAGLQVSDTVMATEDIAMRQHCLEIAAEVYEAK